MSFWGSEGVCEDLDCTDCVDKSECCFSGSKCILGDDCSDDDQDCFTFVSNVLPYILLLVLIIAIVIGIIIWREYGRCKVIQAAWRAEEQRSRQFESQQPTYDNANTNSAPPAYQQQEGNEPPAYEHTEKHQYTDVTTWFEKGVIGIGDVDKKKYVDLFIEKGYEHVEVIKTMTEQDLEKYVIIKDGHRRAIMTAIEKL